MVNKNKKQSKKGTGGKKVLKKGINGHLTLQELIIETIDFTEGKISKEDYNKWSNKLTVKSVLPTMQKLAYLINLMNTYNYTVNISHEMLICEIYKNFFFHVYLGGYLDVQEISEQDMTFENYDLLEPIFGPWIEVFAKRDIELMKSMLRDALSLTSEKSIINALEGINEDTINKQISHNKSLADFLNQDEAIITQLNNIAILQDPAAVELLNTIRENAVKEIKNTVAE